MSWSWLSLTSHLQNFTSETIPRSLVTHGDLLGWWCLFGNSLGVLLVLFWLGGWWNGVYLRLCSPGWSGTLSLSPLASLALGSWVCAFTPGWHNSGSIWCLTLSGMPLVPYQFGSLTSHNKGLSGNLFLLGQVENRSWNCFMSSLYRLILIVNLITLRNHLGMGGQVKVLAPKPGDLSLISEPRDGKKDLATQMVRWLYTIHVL